MKGSLCENTQWAIGLAARLRFLQSSLAGDLPEARARVLNKELVTALKPVAPEKRKPCLEILAAQFPVPEPFETRCQLEAELRKLTAEKDTALKTIEPKETPPWANSSSGSRRNSNKSGKCWELNGMPP